MITIKQRPILFTGEMARAILAGKKTQTRRVIKPQPIMWNGNVIGPEKWLPPGVYLYSIGQWRKVAARYHCPYGWIGERLWAKETWRIASLMYDDAPLIQYRAGGAEQTCNPIDGPGAWDDDKYLEWRHRQWEHMAIDCAKAGIEPDTEGIFRWTTETNPNRWRSSRFMPHWASRTLLEVTDVRVERVQDISPSDILAEGIDNGKVYADDGIHFSVKSVAQLREEFQALWDSINAKRGFDFAANKWVWVIEFKVLESQ